MHLSCSVRINPLFNLVYLAAYHENESDYKGEVNCGNSSDGFIPSLPDVRPRQENPITVDCGLNRSSAV